MVARSLDDLRQLRPNQYHSVTEEDLASYPKMERWFNPVLLAKLLLQVIVSKLFGQYADRRLIHAALDTVPEQELRDRADIANFVEADDEGAIWIDFVADLGDGFDSTYAIAYLLAQDTLDVDITPTRRGSVLVMGGDEVYPVASRDNYILRMRQPYSFAFPDRRGQSHPLVYAIPGNHDWYDGLVVFLSMFCREKATPLGQWRTKQRRSYFALQLRPDWWIWGIDIALTEDMDQPQADYFALMARAMKLTPNSKLILCSAEPGWYKAEFKAESYRCLDYAAWILKNEGTDARIVAVLSGDTHHYARYSSEFGTQFITSGGGGAFLHGTQDLHDELRAVWFYHGESPLSLKTSPDVYHAPSTERACYPSQEESRRLARGNLAFWYLNWDFSLFLGIIYWLLGYALVLRPGLDAHLVVLAVLIAGFAGVWVLSREEEVKGSGVGNASCARALGRVVRACAAVYAIQYPAAGRSARLELVLPLGLGNGSTRDRSRRIDLRAQPAAHLLLRKHEPQRCFQGAQVEFASALPSIED